jgi:BirA family biotin operon repressor/biotin-[acetyl-CoA-carboxylase] ligase
MSGLRWFPPSLIDEAALDASIRVLPRFGSVRYSVGVDSTNARALDVLHRLDSLGISFVTESQDKGRGRAGRSWISPPAAGLYLSTILPAELRGASLGAVGFWAALAVEKSVSNVCPITLALKWPNDLLLGDRKCVGILSEGRSNGVVTRVVLGVGINVNRPEHVPYDISNSAAWLSDATGEAIDRTALLAAILKTYEERFDDLMSRPGEVIAAWRERAGLEGKHAKVKAPNGGLLHEGVIRDLTPEGALLLDTPGGMVTITLGDVDVFS